MDIIIDPEFEQLLPPLAADELAELEKSLSEDGCIQPLVVWEGQYILVDGHNRYRLCQKLGVPFQTVNKGFGSREQAMCWMYTTKLARRNLNSEMLIFCRGRHYELEKRTWGRSDGLNTKVKGQNAPLLSTAERLGKIYSVDPMTIKRDAKVAKAIDAIGQTSGAAKAKLLCGEAKSTKSICRSWPRLHPML